jgi:hypothetical protein
MKMLRIDWRRAARVAAIGVVVVVLIYEIGANVALSSRAIASLVSSHPERLRLKYAGARTFWPGRVHLTGFDLRGREANVEWQVHIDTADVNLSLLALIRRRFEVAKVVATGVTFRARFRLEADALDPDRVARMPPIDGFEATPIVGLPPDTSDPNAKPWTVDLQGVEAQASEVWIDAFRVVGVIDAKGGFTLGSQRLTLAPSTAEIQTTALTTGEDAIATDVTGRLDAQMDTVDLGVVKGPAVLRSLTMSSALEGKMGGIRFIRHFVRNDAVAFSGGSGTFRSEMNLVRGVVMKGTSSRIELEPALLRIKERKVEGRIRIDLTTGDADEANTTPWTRVDVGLSDLMFTEPKAKGPAATCKILKTSARARQIDLAEPEGVTKDFAYSWETPQLDVLDLHAVDDTLPVDSPFHIEHGTATVTTSGRGSLSGASAEVGIESKLTMDVWGARVSSGVKGTVPLKASFLGRSLDLAGTDLTLSDPAKVEWWSKVALGTATIHVEPPSIALALSTTARDGAPFLSLYEKIEGSSTAAKVALGVVPNPMIESMTANLHGGLRLAARRGALDIDQIEAKGAASRLRGVLKKRGDRMDGGLLVEAGPTALGISFASGSTSFVVIDAPKWFETKVAPAERGAERAGRAVSSD